MWMVFQVLFCGPLYSRVMARTKPTLNAIEARTRKTWRGFSRPHAQRDRNGRKTIASILADHVARCPSGSYASFCSPSFSICSELSFWRTSLHALFRRAITRAMFRMVKSAIMATMMYW